MEIKFKNVTADYELGPIRSPLVLKSVNLLLKEGSFTAVIGRTGAGKSTLLKTINGLLLPTEGEIKVGENVIRQNNEKRTLKNVRKKVGMVFQFPEQQLFAQTVEKDICFGPMNHGATLQEAQEKAREVIHLVGLPPEILNQSPHTLSGGQKRRVAIAGVIAMEPDILVLDEPGAGLDPVGKTEIMEMIKSFHDQKKWTTILVTHDMNDVVRYAEDVVVMEQGQVVKHDRVRNVFSDITNVQKWDLDLPEAYQFQVKLEAQTGIQLPHACLTVEELAETLMEVGLV